MYRYRRPPGIENLIETIEKLSIDPVYDTNWSDMSDDIKLKCIRKLEIKERLSLRSTAKAERSLVDSQKIKFTNGRLSEYDERLVFNFYLNDGYFPRSKDIRDDYESIKYIMKIGVFENLTIFVKNQLANYEQFMTDDELFTAKHIKMFDRDQVVAVLRKMDNGVESIKLESAPSDELDQILAIPIVQNVPYWHIRDYHHTDSLHMVANMWIDTNAKIGSTFQVSVSKHGSFEEFLENFDDRIVSKSEKRIRIRTNDPDHHILLERGLDRWVQVDDYLQFFRLIVISAEMKESEYDDNCKEWILELDPRIYDEYYSDTDDIYFDQSNLVGNLPDKLQNPYNDGCYDIY
ncbi:unnamed protein product [Caenorhabditis nigoni]